jgi:hypothetical protein
MIDRGHELPTIRQAQALRLARSSVSYKPQPVSAEPQNSVKPHKFATSPFELGPGVAPTPSANDVAPRRIFLAFQI